MKEIEAEVVKIVGLDYDAFTRSVVLPQGQFDAFLKGEPKERRKILVALLNLGVYEDMHRIANARAADARREAEFIAGQLAVDFKDATQEALAARQEELAVAEAQVLRLEAAQAAVAEGLEVAAGVRAARRELATLAGDVEAEEAKAGKAEATLAEADGQRARLEAEEKAAEAALATIGFDADRHAALLGARPQARQLADLAPKADRLDRAVSDKRASLEAAGKALAAAERAVPAAEQGVGAARSALEKARAERDELRRHHAAAELRRHLKPGAACPVCEQVVKAVPKGAAGGLDAVEAAVAKAETADRAAADALSHARVGLERARGELAGLEKELTAVFERLRVAHDALADPDARAEYDRHVDDTDGVGAAGRAEADPEARRQLARRNFEHAMDYIAMKDYFPAIELLQEAVRFDPEVAEYRFRLGEIELKNSKWIERGLDNLKGATRVEPARADFLRGTARALVTYGRKREAEPFARRAHELEPCPESAALLSEVAARQTVDPTPLPPDSEPGGLGGFFSRILRKGK